MVIPKGKVVHEDLSTSYTNIHELLSDLRQNSFTGYCQVNFWEYRGTLFLDRGRIINACEEIGTEQNIGDRAIKSILNKASQKDGTVSVFQLQDEMVATLASVLNSKVKYKDLTTELTSLEKLISKLKKEEHSGYVEVLLNSDSGDGCIYFQDGRAMESVFRAADGEMISGPSGFKKILGLSTEVGAVFNVYESDMSTIIVDNSVTDEVLRLFQDAVSAIEDAVDAKLGAGKFMDDFKRIIAMNANKYLFLDPFAGEFSYKDKTIKFEGETTLEDFTSGLADVITQVVELFGQKDNSLLDAIFLKVQSVKERHLQVIERLKLDMKIPSAFGDRTVSETEHKEDDSKEAKGKRRFWPFGGKKSSEDA